MGFLGFLRGAGRKDSSEAKESKEEGFGEKKYYCYTTCSAEISKEAPNLPTEGCELLQRQITAF